MSRLRQKGPRMKVIHGPGGRCEKTRKYLDYYLSDELSIEASLELTGDLASCHSCLQELQLRMRLKHRLRRAVGQERIPPGLRVRVMKRIRQGIF